MLSVQQYLGEDSYHELALEHVLEIGRAAGEQDLVTMEATFAVVTVTYSDV